MNAAQLSADVKLCRVFAAENATLSVGLLPAEPFRPPSNGVIIKDLLRQDGLTTFSGSGGGAGFKISRKFLRLV
jgi:hypothetical protein